MKCSRCSFELSVQATDEGTFLRNVCSCEKRERCGKCANMPVVQTLLESDGETVKRYVCRAHANADYLSDDAVQEMKAIEGWDTITKEAVEADLKDGDWKVRCSGCKKIHKHSQRRVVAAPNAGHFNTFCPDAKCAARGFFMEE